MYVPRKQYWWLGVVAVLVAVVYVFNLLRDVLMPFITAAVLAYILNPLVVFLERHGIRRGRASMWVMGLAFFALVGLLLVIVPMLVKQFQSIIGKLPLLVVYVQHTILPWFHAKFGHYLALDVNTVVTWLRDNTQNIQAALQKAMPMLLQQGTSIAGWLGNVVLLPLLLYYFLLDWSRWENGLAMMMPRRYVGTYSRIAGKLNRVLGEFLRGQLTVMMIMGLLYGLGLRATGLESGFAIGMVAGILVFVPYLGAFTGLLLATLAAILQFSTWTGVLMVWSVFAVGQLLESFFITPKIVGDRIGLSPFWVIFALLAFGNVMGFVGMLVALPLAAICLVLIDEGKRVYLNSAFYLREK